nr:MAG TPA: hypothetical protein [Bacteriophage sp.]
MRIAISANYATRNATQKKNNPYFLRLFLYYQQVQILLPR